MTKTDFKLIIDFDSTFIKVEAFEALAEITLKNNQLKNQIIEKIKQITKKGMQGEMGFPKSLKKRLSLFKPDKNDIKTLIKLLKKSISSSILKNKDFFQKYSESIYIVSGGFIDYIQPVCQLFGIKPAHILANALIYDKKGQVIGFDKKNLLAKEHGKIKAVNRLNLKGKIYVVGDGWTDYQIKQADSAVIFCAFAENVKRVKVVKMADYLIADFDQLIRILNLSHLNFKNSKKKVLLLENINLKARLMFEQEGYQVKTLPCALTENELLKKIADVSILGIRSKTIISRLILNQAKQLLAVGAYCIGLNQIDLKAAQEKNIAVFNDPYSNTRSVAELTVGEIIMLCRRIFEKNAELHQGVWDKTVDHCFEIRGKKLGIVGYGNIGSQVSHLSEGLGIEVYFYDLAEKLILGKAKKCNTLEQLLKTADVVTVHVDGRKSNKNLIGEKEFNLMKKKALLLNLSRGFVVDIKALIKNLKLGRLGGAAIDVFENEPKNNHDFFKSELQNMPNVILTPHIAGNTIEAQENIAKFITKKLLKYASDADFKD